MVGWVYAWVYIFLEARPTLEKSQLAGEPYLGLGGDCEARRAATLAATNATAGCTYFCASKRKDTKPWQTKFYR